VSLVIPVQATGKCPHNDIVADADDGATAQPDVSSSVRLGSYAALLLAALFKALDLHGVRYCVLHGWQRLPEVSRGDVDLAVHPEDRRKLSSAFGALASQEFRLVQCLNYAPGGYYFVFAWAEAGRVGVQAIDIVFEHRRLGLAFDTSDKLVAGRQRERTFWIASPATQFRYLLIKKVHKGELPAHQALQLKALADELGQQKAEEIAVRLFGKTRGRQIVDACRNGEIAPLVRGFRSSLFWTAVLRNPMNPLRVAWDDIFRLRRRWVQPTGVFVALLGPDGIGKSTLGMKLSEGPTAAFRRTKLFHWRPAVLRHRKDAGPVTDPHGRPQHAAIRSTLWLVFQLLDYSIGYALVVRPLLARSGLVIFDRYFDDLLVDQKRYRCGAPLWMIRLARRLTPRPDLLLVMDAPTNIVRSRKQEVSEAESERQQAQYRALGQSARLIDASLPPEQVYASAISLICDYLARRCQRRHQEWLRP
jgi:thymidylate kinase